MKASLALKEGRLKDLLLWVSGMMLGGGCGRELAHWIVHGRPEKDMYGYDIRCLSTPARRREALLRSAPALMLMLGANTLHVLPQALP